MEMKDQSYDALVSAYVKIRDRKAALTHAYDASIEPLDRALKDISRAMGAKMAEAGAQSVRTEHGTVYQQVKRHSSCGDWGSFHQWVIENNRCDLLQRRLNNTGIVELVEETNALPPGIALVSEMTIGVRKN